MNIYDIAAEAGVSISTVSRVMNHKGNVNPEMKKRIEEVLKKYDYKPSAIARGMVSKTMKTVAVLVTDIRIPQFASQVYAVEQEFSREGYNVMVCNTGENIENCDKYINTLSQKQVDGIVTIGSVFSRLAEYPEITSKMRWSPVVMANGEIDLPNFYSVLLNEQEGLRAGIRLLYGKDKKKICLLCDLETNLGARMKESFLKILKDLKIDGKEEQVISCKNGMEEGAWAVRLLMENGCSFDGLIFGGEITAIGGMKELRKAGLRIPEDVSVIGWGDSISALTCQPELTTVDMKAEQMGILCVRILHGPLQNQEPQAPVIIEPEIILRGSTG